LSRSVVPNLFWCIRPFAHLGTFHSSPITQIQQGGWTCSNVIFPMTQITRIANLIIKWKFLSWTHEIPPWGGIPSILGTNGLDGNVYSTQAQASSSFEPVLSVHCLTALDLREGAKQPVDCFIIQIRQWNPWGGRWIEHWKITWSTVRSSALHSHAAEAAILQLCKPEQKRLTAVRRRMSRTHTVSGAATWFALLVNHLMYVVPCVSFRTIENWNKAPVKILASWFPRGPWPHSGCTAARCSGQCHSRRVGQGESMKSRSALQPLCIPLHFCYCRQLNWWVVEQRVQNGLSRFEIPCIPTQWTGERWVEQVSRIHGTAC